LVGFDTNRYVASFIVLFKYPIRLRWGKHAEEGFGEEQRVSPILKKAFSVLIPRLLAAGRFITNLLNLL
jgi:hypothetical protein